jgi:hypothetical protein
MTDEEIDVAVALELGWIRTDKWRSGWLMPPDKDGFRLPGPVHNFTKDLNLCAEFEGTLTTVGEWTEYTSELFKIIQPNFTLWEAACTPDMNGKMYILSLVVKATARQRCEAFLRLKRKFATGPNV